MIIPVAKPLHAGQDKPRQTFTPRVGLEPIIPVFEQTMTFHALDSAATAIGDFCSRLFNYLSPVVVDDSKHDRRVITKCQLWPFECDIQILSNLDESKDYRVNVFVRRYIPAVRKRAVFSYWSV